MGKYQSYSRRDEVQKAPPVHPIWRGIGFAMMVLIPVLAYFGMRVILEQNQVNRWFVIPADLLVKWSDPLILVKAIIMLVIAFVLYMVFLLVTFFIYRVFAPPRYGPLDVPPSSYRGKKRLR